MFYMRGEARGGKGKSGERGGRRGEGRRELERRKHVMFEYYTFHFHVLYDIAFIMIHGFLHFRSTLTISLLTP